VRVCRAWLCVAAVVADNGLQRIIQILTDSSTAGVCDYIIVGCHGLSRFRAKANRLIGEVSVDSSRRAVIESDRKP